ncbi:MAG: hypothetical protein K6G04_06405 [Lachnospiraceae bacterium]|nr:hypothetical protein [Lachnospiraceae bacterium]
MNQEDKKKLQNDILLAAEISRQFHLKRPEEAKKVVAFIHDRKPFLSPRGAAFQQRMEALAAGEEVNCTCMLCMQKEADRGIFCEDCLAVIDHSVNGDKAAKQPQEEPTVEPEIEEPAVEEIPIEEAPIEEIPVKEPPIEETPIEEIPEEVLAIEESVIEPEPEATTEPEIEAEPQKEVEPEVEPEESLDWPTEEAIEEERPEDIIWTKPPRKALGQSAEGTIDTDLWGDAEKERKKLPVWVWVLLVFFVLVMIGVGVLIFTGYQIPGVQWPLGNVTVENQEDGITVVEREYSEKDYNISDKEPLSAPEGMFLVHVGDYVGDSWDTGLIEVYAYSVVSKEDAEQSAVLWVAEDGRTVGYGTLIDPEEPNKIYRIR